MFTRKVGALLSTKRTLALLAVSGVFSFGWTDVADARAKAKKKEAAAAHVVTIKGFKFDPQELAVKPGDTIEWVNEDILPHTATASGKVFDSGSIGSKQNWKWTAKQKGSFPYACNYHPTMKATVTVK